MNPDKRDRLYNLLPALYRNLDELEGRPLHALLAVLQEEVDQLEEDMQAQYDNWFIETCDRWVIPYIADLVGVHGLEDPQQLSDGQRRHVANALRYRRRKGTLAVLEQALRDVSGWPAYANEYYRYLAMTQHLNNLRPDAGHTFDVRDRQALSNLDTPFDSGAHTADLRANRAAGQQLHRGRYNMRNVGLFLWRLRPYPVVHSPARPVRSKGGAPFRFKFDPLGRDIQLFNKPLPAPDGMYMTTMGHLPLPLTRELLANDLAAYADRPETEQLGSSTFYGPDRGLVIKFGQYRDADGTLKRRIVPPEAVLSVPLWKGLEGLDVPEGKLVAIDVQRGRFAFLTDDPDDRPDQNEIPVVSYTYAFSDDIGDGPYERTIPAHYNENNVLHVYVAEGCANESIEEPPEQWNNPGPWQAQASTLAHAFDVWDKYYEFCIENHLGQGLHPTAVIHIVDNGIYGGRNVENGNDLRVRLGRGSRLSIIAADGVRPVIRTLHNLVFSCELGSEAAAPERQLHLNGLLVHSEVVIPASPFSGSLAIDINHCTLMPGGIAFEAAQPASQQSRLSIKRSLVGPVKLASSMEQISISDSIIDGQGAAAISIDGEGTTEKTLAQDCLLTGSVTLASAMGQISVSDCILDSDGETAIRTDGERNTGKTLLKRLTVLGAASLPSLTYAQDCLFMGPVMLASVHADDDIRHCYLRALVIKGLSKKLDLDYCEPPVFTSTTYGDPAYCQLSLETADEILRGAANGSSLGAFSRLNEPQRYAGIRPMINEYLPLGMEADVFYVT